MLASGSTTPWMSPRTDARVSCVGAQWYFSRQNAPSAKSRHLGFAPSARTRLSGRSVDGGEWKPAGSRRNAAKPLRAVGCARKVRPPCCYRRAAIRWRGAVAVRSGSRTDRTARGVSASRRGAGADRGRLAGRGQAPSYSRDSPRQSPPPPRSPAPD